MIINRDYAVLDIVWMKGNNIPTSLKHDAPRPSTDEEQQDERRL